MNTSHPKPRGILPDSVKDGCVYLFKACSYLRLTYEIKLGAFFAQQHGEKLVLVVAKQTKFAPPLQEFVSRQSIIVQRGS